jgi:hypothetical protein
MTDVAAADRAQGRRTPEKPRTLLLLVTVLAANAGFAQASAAADSASAELGLRFSGFGTLGVVHAETDRDWLFARDVSQKGAGSDTSALPDSRLGLQLNWQPGGAWEAALQAVLRPRTHDVRFDEYFEMGFVAWRPSAGWTLRAGRIKPDLFLLHNSRNVGYAMPWVRPNTEFYGWIPSASMDGASVAYDWADLRASWTAQMWLGEMSNTVAALRTDDSLRWKGRNTLGLTLTRQSGPLMLKASFAQTESDLGSSPDLELLEGTLLGIAALPVGEVAVSAQELYRGLLPQGTTRYLGLGAEFDSGVWLASAEISRVSIERGATGGTRGYASVGRRYGAVTLFTTGGFSQPRRASPAMHGDWVAELTPYLGANEAMGAAMAGAYAAQYATDARFDQESVGAGLRWDLFDRVALKAQFDRVHVEANGAGQWRHSSDEAGHVNLLSLAIDWVF